MNRRDALRVLVLLALHAAARDVDRALGLLLHTSLDLPGFVGEALRLVDPSSLLASVGAWCAGGLALWLVAGGGSASFLLPLLLRPAITLLAVASLAVDPAYPYGFTLPIALTQDWGIAQDTASACAILAALAPRITWRWRVPAPGPVSLGFMAFVAYALLSPAWAYRWEAHPGNEPKTLRMAVAIGHWMTLDVEPVSAGMEDLPVDAAPTAIARAVRGAAHETGRMITALPEALSRDAIRATRVTRQTIRGKEGGVYHVLAPGPSVLLAPTLRADRWLNRRDGHYGRLAVSVLLWNALAAALVGALFALLRDATGRKGLSALIAGGAALVPPFVFYAYQFYPEMLGALVLTIAFRELVFRTWWRGTHAWSFGVLIATLPWLHQKFLPVWAVLAAWAVLKIVGELAPLRTTAGIVIPQAVSLVLFALYNFSITGSVRPDALFLAWGPGGVSGARIGQGLIGLLLDARYGIAPYVPILLMGGGALFMKTPLRRALPAAAVYYATVAAADNWSGAVCNLGRYFMPVAPFAIALVAVVLARAGSRAGVRAIAMTLAAWTGILAWILANDPHAANDCAQLLARSAFADGTVYIPGLFLRAWSDAAPGLWARVLAWATMAAILAWWTARAGEGRAGGSATRALATGAAVILAFAFALERWPPSRRSAQFADAVEVRSGVTVFPGDKGELIVRSRESLAAIRVRATGRGTVRVAGQPPVMLADAQREIDVALTPFAHVTGRRGVEEWLYRQRIETDGAVAVDVAR
jgi:hypothetical protein